VAFLKVCKPLLKPARKWGKVCDNANKGEQAQEQGQGNKGE
jgi:hypothetical protein